MCSRCSWRGHSQACTVETQPFRNAARPTQKVEYMISDAGVRLHTGCLADTAHPSSLKPRAPALLIRQPPNTRDRQHLSPKSTASKSKNPRILTKQILSKHRACSHARASANITRSQSEATPDRRGQDKSALATNRPIPIGSQTQTRTAGFLTATLDIDDIYFSHPSRLQLLDMQPSPMRKLSTPPHPPIQHT